MPSPAVKRSTLHLDPDGLTDLSLIAQRMNGKGEALRRMMARADMSQQDLAIAIGKHRTAVCSWVAEDRWPTDEDLRRALGALGIDRRQLLDCWGVLLSTEISPRTDITQLAVTLKLALDFEDDPLERKLIIGRTLEEEVYLRQGFKGREDTRAAEFFMARTDKYREESRQAALGNARDVTPSQATWMQNPYDKKAPVNSDTSPDTQVPEDKDTPTTTET